MYSDDKRGSNIIHLFIEEHCNYNRYIGKLELIIRIIFLSRTIQYFLSIIFLIYNRYGTET